MRRSQAFRCTRLVTLLVCAVLTESAQRVANETVQHCPFQPSSTHAHVHRRVLCLRALLLQSVQACLQRTVPPGVSGPWVNEQNRNGGGGADQPVNSFCTRVQSCPYVNRYCFYDVVVLLHVCVELLVSPPTFTHWNPCLRTCVAALWLNWLCRALQAKPPSTELTFQCTSLQPRAM